MGRKRRHGEGSIYQRSDGRWIVSIDMGIVDGKRKRVERRADSQKEAVKLLRELQRQKDQGVVFDGTQTVKEYIEDWLENVVRITNSPGTYKSYNNRCRKHILPAIGHKRLDKLTNQDVQSIVARMVDNDNVGNQYIDRVITTLNVSLNRAVKIGLIPRNVAKHCDLPKIQKKEMKYFTMEQARKFLDVLQGNKLEALFWIATLMGLRRGEILNLKWNDINFDTRRMFIRESKTRAGVRTLPIPDSVVLLLKEHRVNQMKMKLRAGERWQEHDLVFTSKLGTQVSLSVLRHHFFKALDDAGLPKIRFHDLRHTAATIMLKNGASMKEVQIALGHDDFSVTSNTYAHVADEDVANMFARVAEQFRRKKDGT